MHFILEIKAYLVDKINGLQSLTMLTKELTTLEKKITCANQFSHVETRCEMRDGLERHIGGL